ncbi:MAG: DNA cytosine methyltransferase [Chloroflexi bacterium]|nr:DNA cytosine methyltransferase [Chloroflexota bacterium]
MQQLHKRLKEHVPSPMFVDLFCGCGGMSWGLAQARFHVLAGLDIDKASVETYRRNFGRNSGMACDLTALSPADLADYLNLRPQELDLLVGGPPCQGFSKNVPRKQRFLEDPRNLLVRRFLDYAEYLRPKVLIMENVAEMKGSFEGAYTNEIRERLEAIGYLSCPTTS